MGKIEYKFFNKTSMIDDTVLFFIDNRADIDKVKELCLKLIRQSRVYKKEYNKLTDEEIINKIKIIDENNKPNTFPKFNNESKFKFKYGNKLNPKITTIAWFARENKWKYVMENIGHKGQYYEEDLLIKCG